jgi:hypothetical protein
VYIRWTRSGRPEQALAAGILADLEEDLADRLLDRSVMDRVRVTVRADDVAGGDVGLADL